MKGNKKMGKLNEQDSFITVIVNWDSRHARLNTLLLKRGTRSKEK